MFASFFAFPRRAWGVSVAEKPWGGVFRQPTDRRVEEFTESVSFDRRLYAHDVSGSIAHAQMLAKVGLISADECQAKLSRRLLEIRQEIERRAVHLPPNSKTSTCTSSGR